MAGKSLKFGNFASSPEQIFNVSGKEQNFHTSQNAPGLKYFPYATGGTIINDNDGYIYHIFTGNDTFVVNSPSGSIDSIEYLIVAGGGAGGGGSTPGGGGGGGGGFLFGNLPITNTSYPITVGAGGPNTPSSGAATVRNGSPSTAFGLTAIGGGGGGGFSGTPPGTTGADGGSGGGGAGPDPAPGFGLGNTPATIPRQGYPGGYGYGPGATAGQGRGGGGGAGGPGSPGNPPESSSARSGGLGRISPSFPANIVRRAIPAPIIPSWLPLVGPSGYAGGGSGDPFPVTTSASANSGYGSQGKSSPTNGGSGIVCVRYAILNAIARASGGNFIEPSTHPEHIGVFRHIFTTPGTFTVIDKNLKHVDYLVVAGGGAGGRGGTKNSGPAPFNLFHFSSGGGGGAGGFVSSIHTSTTTPLTNDYPWSVGASVHVGKQFNVVLGSYSITVGSGGVAVNTSVNSYTSGTGGSGSPSSIGSEIIANGGGGGGAMEPQDYNPIIPTNSRNGIPGGSGGGGAKIHTSPVGAGSGGTATPTPLMQGNPGSDSSSSPGYTAGGGGGAGAGANSDAQTTVGDSGGIGQISVLSPSNFGTSGPVPGYRYFAGGGGGAGGLILPSTLTGSGGAGGSGGGGAGGSLPVPGGGASQILAVSGTSGTGGGGGGARSTTLPSYSQGGDGGSGIVIIQYPE